jgi:amino acid transporter
MATGQGTLTADGALDASSSQLIRAIDWRGAFWVASGVPALVLFSIGGIAGVAGKVAFLVWTVSMLMGLIQSFTYAEIAGLFPNKSGGASVYGAAAWVRYSKLIAPLSVWCNWFAWTPVLSLGCSIAAAYILNSLAPIPPADAPHVLAWVSAHASSIAQDSRASSSGSQPTRARRPPMQCRHCSRPMQSRL